MQIPTTEIKLVQAAHNLTQPRQLLSWILASLLATLGFLSVCLFFYFTGEDFIFIRFASTGKPFYDTAQNLFYRPLPNLLWQLDYSLWGLQPAGYHLTNLLLHAINTVLVGWLGYRLTANPKVGGYAALIFGLHPVHTEPVSWLAGRPDLLATGFFLVAVLAWLKFGETKQLLWLALAVSGYASGLFSKESVAALPVILAAWWLWRLPARRWAWLLWLIPFGLVALGYLAARLNALGSLGGYDTSGSLLVNSLWNASGGLWWPLLFPLNIESGGWWCLMLGVGLAGCYGWLAWQMRRTWRKNLRLGCLLLILIYGGLAAALPNAPAGLNLEQSRLLYLPSVGFCIGLAGLLTKIKPSRWLLLPVAISLGTLGLALLPWWQAGQIAQHTFQLAGQANLPLEAGDTIYYEGLPDSWHGAYIWRNGLDDATKLLLNPGVRGFNRVGDIIVDYKRGRLWTNRFELEPSGRLDWIFSYSVDSESVAQPQTEFGQPGCDSGWKWELTGGVLTCQTGQGLLWDTQSQKVSLTLAGPVVERSVKTLEFSAYVYFDFQHPQVLSELVLSDTSGKELVRHPFDLAADGKWHRYRLYLPAAVQNSRQLSLRILKNRNNILFKAFQFS